MLAQKHRIVCLADKWQRRPFIKLNYNYGCSPHADHNEGRGGSGIVGGIWPSESRRRLHFWRWLWHSACQIRALTAISCGYPAIPNTEGAGVGAGAGAGPEPEPAPDDAAVAAAAALGHAAQTFPLCNYFKSKAKLDRPAPPPALSTPPDVDFQCDSCLLTQYPPA